MHDSVHAWIDREVDNYGGAQRVVELGSLDVNGNVRDQIPHVEWVGYDIVDGDGVDVVANAHDVGDLAPHADLVLCLEMLEHDDDPNATFASIAAVLTTDGQCWLSTRSRDFPYHHPPDWWRFTHSDIHALAFTAGLVVTHIEDDTQDGHPGVFAILTKP